MPPKPNARKWNDIQTAIATVGIVAAIGLWNLFATPSKTTTAVQTQEPIVPPTDPPVSAEPTQMPYVKIMFTPGAPQTVSNFQNNPQPQKPKKKNRNNNNGGGGGTVTQTKSS
jgi:hypothetical protein